MKYKVGDRVRLKDGSVCHIKDCFVLLSLPPQDGYHVQLNDSTDGYTIIEDKISHQIISEITDELINRFKNEKIAWHFKSEEDYEKTLDILYSKGVTYGSNRWKFFKECISYHNETLWRADIDYYQEEEYEIIEIMNPMYVPTNMVIDDEWIDIDVIRYVENNLEPQYKDYKKQYYYKNMNVEDLYRHYMQQKKIPDLEKKVENQKVEIKNLHNKIDEMQKTLTCEIDYRKALENENYSLKFQKEKMLKDLDKMTFQLGRIAGIVDEDC